jgi:hypothetical protein
MIASLSSVWLQNSKVVYGCKNYFLCVIAKTAGYYYDCRKKELNQCVFATILRAWLQPEVICGCKTWLCLCGWKATWLFGIWLQAWVVCDCKNYFVCVIANTAGYFMTAKKPEAVCDCNYFACAIPTRSYLWLHHDWVCFGKKATGYLWLQAWVVCDCKTAGLFVIAKNYFVCVIANTAGYFTTEKTASTSLWLQLFCVCNCNQKLSYVVPWRRVSVRCFIRRECYFTLNVI